MALYIRKYSMEAGNSANSYDIAGIQAAFTKLKDARVVLTWGEFADNIEYDRTYVSRVINGHEPLTPDFSNAVKKYVESTINVPRGTKDETRQDHKKDMIHPYTLSDKRLKNAEPEENQQEDEKLKKTVLNLSEAILRLMDENAVLKASKNENS